MTGTNQGANFFWAVPTVTIDSSSLRALRVQLFVHEKKPEYDLTIVHR